MAEIRIADRAVGPGRSCFVIAEAGVNHNGDVAIAKQLIAAAHAVGADAVKFQTFRSDLVVTAQAPKADYQLRTTERGESQLEMIRRLELPTDAFRELVHECARVGIMFLSTAGDAPSADLLSDIGAPAIKLASSEITNLLLLRHVAALGLPMLVSTGMSTLGEVELACETITAAGDPPVLLFHCVSQYPAPPGDANLRAIDVMARALGAPIGFSDHTPGITVSLAAVAVGACAIEKHLTLDRTMPGPDHGSSLEPDEFRRLVSGIREVELALGDGHKRPMPSEEDTRRIARRSLVAAVPIPAGTALQADMVTMKRPGTGMSASLLPLILGRRARIDIGSDTMLSVGLFE